MKKKDTIVIELINDKGRRVEIFRMPVKQMRALIKMQNDKQLVLLKGPDGGFISMSMETEKGCRYE